MGSIAIAVLSNEPDGGSDVTVRVPAGEPLNVILEVSPVESVWDRSSVAMVGLPVSP
jgi:hypothetical protein